MTKPRGRKRRIDQDEVVAYATANPTKRQAEIAAHFQTTQSWIGDILEAKGVKSVRRGRPLKLQPGQTTEEHYWETVLHDAGLGVDRGLRLGRQRIFYGYDMRKETYCDGSATLRDSDYEDSAAA